MNCKRCGNILEPTDMVCRNCGEPVNNTEINQANNQVNFQQINPQQVNTNMNFQNNEFQTNQTQNLNSQTPMSSQSINNVNLGAQQSKEQNFSQNLNSQPNNTFYNQNTNMEQFSNQNFNSNQSFNVNQPENVKKKNNLFIIIVIALVLIIGVLGYFIVSKKLLNKGADEDVATPSNNNNSTTTEEPTQVANANSYSFKNFEFPIPSSYYPAENAERESLQLINNVDKVMAEMFVWSYVTIDDYKEELNSIKSQLAGQGITVKSDVTKNISGIDWIILYCTVTHEGKTLNMIETFASLGNYHVLEVAIANYGTKSNEYILTDLSNMISNTTYKGTKNFSSNDKNEKPTINGTYNFDESVFE